MTTCAPPQLRRPKTRAACQKGQRPKLFGCRSQKRSSHSPPSEVGITTGQLQCIPQTAHEHLERCDRRASGARIREQRQNAQAEAGIQERSRRSGAELRIPKWGQNPVAESKLGSGAAVPERSEKTGAEPEFRSGAKNPDILARIPEFCQNPRTKSRSPSEKTKRSDEAIMRKLTVRILTMRGI